MVAEILRDEPELATMTDEYGFQTIHALKSNGFEKKLELLLRHCADVNARGAECGNTLMNMVQNAAMIPSLVVVGADVNAQDASGKSVID